MFTMLNRIRQAHLLTISHRMGDMDCSLAALKKLNSMNMDEDMPKVCAKVEKLCRDVVKKTDDKQTSFVDMLFGGSAFLTVAAAVTQSEALLPFMILAFFVTWGSFGWMVNAKSGGARYHTMKAAEAEAWLMEHATEARMLHVRRALHMLISHRPRFHRTQSSRFNELLDACINLYIALLQEAEAQPRLRVSIQNWATKSLPPVIRTVLHTRMYTNDRHVLAAYDVDAVRIMEGLVVEAEVLLKHVREPDANYMGATAMAAQLNEMEDQMLRDGLIEKDSKQDDAQTKLTLKL